jgi:GGDEF domain-containing protein
MSESSYTASLQIPRRESRSMVLPNRRRFAASVDSLLDGKGGSSAGYALLHVVAQSFSGSGCVSLRVLNLVDAALRTGRRDTEVGYLGEAEFAVFLPDVDASQAGLYARDIAAAVTNFSLRWDDEMFSVSASIGCVVGRGSQDGTSLLYQAVRASELAAGKSGYQVQLVHAASAPRAQRADVQVHGAWAAFA